MLYEIKYEAATFSGTKMVWAESDEQALAEFKSDWEIDGDEAPSAWVSGRWIQE